MRTSPAGITAFVFLLLSCNLLEPSLSLGEPRISDQIQGYETTRDRDTVFYISAVSFPKTYDWQRDSAFGSVACTLKLFRNSKCTLALPAGPSAQIGAAPDMHHFLGSSLFTEYADYRGTVIKRNGVLLAQWPESEKLQGMMYKDGTLHTLGLSRTGESLTYRRDGIVVRKIQGAVPMGGFGMDTYGPEGALYEDEGHVCYAYKTVWDKEQSVFFVRDGEILCRKNMPESDVLDARLLCGEPLILYNKAGCSMLHKGDNAHFFLNAWGRVWKSGGILEYQGRLAAAGFFIDNHYDLQAGVGWESNRVLLDKSTSYIYCDGDNLLGMSAPPGYYFFNRNCAFLLGGRLARVITPKDGRDIACFEFGGNSIEYNLHGYLSAVTAELPQSHAD